MKTVSKFARRAQRNRSALRRKGGHRTIRLSVHRSAQHIYAQVINDKDANTVAAASTMQKEFREIEKKPRGLEAAKWVGKQIAEKALEAGIKQVVFDKGQYLYHGRVKALAESAREAGLDF